MHTMVGCRWIRRYYKPISPVLDEFVSIFYRYPYKLAAVTMVMSNVTFTTTSIFNSDASVWWFKYYYDGHGTNCK